MFRSSRNFVIFIYSFRSDEYLKNI